MDSGKRSSRLKTSIAALAAMAALMSLLAGCCLKGPCPVPNLRLPPASEVEHIEVTRWEPNGNFDSNFKISGPQRIEEILAQLQSINSDFSNTMEGQSPQEYSMAFEGRQGLKALVWIGPDWLGGVDNRHRDRYGELEDRHRQLGQEDHRELVALLAR